VSRKLALTISEALFRAARKVTLGRNTQVKKLVREFSGEQGAAMIIMEEVFRDKPFVVGKMNWTRAEMHRNRR
jgi:hypothetical protein